MSKKFKSRIPKRYWSLEETRSRIETIKNDIADLNRIDSRFVKRFNALKEEKRILNTKIKDKWRYYRQLVKQLNEIENG